MNANIESFMFLANVLRPDAPISKTGLNKASLVCRFFERPFGDLTGNKSKMKCLKVMSTDCPVLSH